MTRAVYRPVDLRRCLAGILAVALLTIGSAPLVAAGLPQSSGPRTLTFNEDIAPLLYERCAVCHRPGASAPFSLLTYDDAVAHASQIEEVTRLRTMPPWMPVAGVGDFQNARALSVAEIARIRDWVAQGRQRGDASKATMPPQWTDGWRLGAPDLIITVPEVLVLKADGADVFRTLVVPIPAKARRYVRAIDFDPGSARAIHHANIKIDATRSSRWLDAQEEGAGYEGAGGRGASFPDGYFLSWTPGQAPMVVPDGLSWRLEPSSDLVLEIHLVPTGTPEPVQPRVALYFTDRPPSQLPYTLRLGRQDLDIAAGDRAYENTDTYTLPIDASIVAVQPQAHLLAREVRASATLPDGSVVPLLYIDDWDFRWQETYRFRTPIRVPGGTRLSMRYVYDNSSLNRRNPNPPPQRITFGPTSSSELGDLWVQVMPTRPADRDRLDRDYTAKRLRDDMAGIEKRLALGGTDPRLHSDLGFCYLAVGRQQEALAEMQTAAALQPLSPSAQYDVGTVLMRERRFAEAGDYFSAAIRLKPDFSEAYNNLGVVNHVQGRVADAVAWYTRASLADAENPEAEYNLGRALASLGEFDQAIQHYERSLELRGDDAMTQSSMGALFISRNQVDLAVLHYRRALAIDQNQMSALVDLAWILATTSRTDIRSPEEAIRLAQRVDDLTLHKSATVLDTLGAAYAAAGRIPQAIEAAQQALDLATSTGQQALGDTIRARLELYRQKL